MDRNAESIRQRLEQVFGRIQAERMQAMPLLHPGLVVEALGFRRTGAARVGVLITPWSMNLLRLPDAGPGAQPIAQPITLGRTATHSLPRGPVDFVGAQEDGIGDYETCSLFSPMLDFVDQEAARAVAFETLMLLLRPAPEIPTPERHRAGGGPVAALRRNAQQDYDRRGFLSGAFLDDPAKPR